VISRLYDVVHSRLEPTPDLERHGWRQRRPLSAAVHRDRWTTPQA